MGLCARIREPMRLSTFFRSLLSLYLQQLRSSFMSNDFRVWKEVYSIKGSVWTKSIWNKILAQPGIMHIFLKLTYSLSVLSLHSSPSHYGVPDFLGKSYLLSIPYKPLLLTLPGSETHLCDLSTSVSSKGNGITFPVPFQCCFLTAGPLLPAFKTALWEWTSENQPGV